MLACLQALVRPVMNEAMQPLIHTARTDPGVYTEASSASASLVFVSPETHTRAPNAMTRGTSTAGGGSRAAVAGSRRRNRTGSEGGVDLVEHALDVCTPQAPNGMTRGTSTAGGGSRAAGSRAAVAGSRRRNREGSGVGIELVEHTLDVGSQRVYWPTRHRPQEGQGW